jgi:hypothetical protein
MIGWRAEAEASAKEPAGSRRYERQGFPPELLLAQALQRAVADLAEGAVQEMVAR